ncbi:MAG: O-antigen ligase family protein, partial [Proteobacteria bacterium]|nr:O-antigen ligase family protein [Pseudomonadota bacterium]
KRFKSTSPGKLIEERYELWLIVYLCIIFLSTLSNTIDGNLSLKDFIVINTKYLFFPIIYFSIKLFEDNNTFETLKKIIVNLSIFSSIIAIIQLLINDQFFRFGTYEYAFGDTLRATGLFHGEYTLGFFCITSTLFVLTSDRKNNLVLTLNFIAVIFTFHRLSIGLLFVSYFLYFVIHKKNKKTYLSIFSILFFVLLSVSYMVIINNYNFSNLSQTIIYKERLKADTLSGRINQYKNATMIISENLFGFGSYHSKLYYIAAAKIGQLHYTDTFDYDHRKKIGQVPIGYIVHNGFLGAGTRYGIMGLIAFFMFCTSTILYANRKYQQGKDKNSMTLLIICIIWFLYQTTQDFSELSSYQSIHFGIILASATRQKKTHSR